MGNPSEKRKKERKKESSSYLKKRKNAVLVEGVFFPSTCSLPSFPFFPAFIGLFGEGPATHNTSIFYIYYLCPPKKLSRIRFLAPFLKIL